MIDVNALLQALGYLRSERHWVTPENADTRLSHLYRLAQRAGEQAGDGAAVVGSYVYTTSLEDRVTPPRPAVFVSYAHDEEQARSIHRHFWNMGDCPFVIVVLPASIRVYTGFDYAHDNPERALIAEAPVSLLDDLPESLKPFHAQAIDSGAIWEQQAKRLASDTRVDYRLLTSLKKLSLQLQNRYGLARPVAHALIGKYIYFRYLRDRAILDDDWLAMKHIRPLDVFGRDATVEGFEALSKALQIQFNGAIFPLPSEDDGQWRVNGAIRFLAATFHGDTFDGQLVLDFGAYDFSYIPVELLSSVYEQFLKAEGKGQGDGVVYTPEALADYVLAEMEAVHPLQLTHRVLDPCCGSGVFLVLAYRRLIEKMWREQDERPSAEALKLLLQTNIFGVEKDSEACDITAFSLILTLLSHLEPPELRANVDFQFPTLVGENIHPADFFDPDCPVFQNSVPFDWIVGNPPWASADERNSNHALALAWMRDAEQQGRAVGEKRLDEAFTWRTGELLHKNGCAGLLVKATTLVNSRSSTYRKAFFRHYEVRRVSNLSNLRYILFTGPEGRRAVAPCACLVYANTTPSTNKPSILHFGPFVADQLPVRAKAGRRRAWTITLYESDIQQVDPLEAEGDSPYLWKTALWGSFQDRRMLRHLQHLLPTTLDHLATERKWLIANGLLLYRGRGVAPETFISVPELVGQKRLKSVQGRRLWLGQESTTSISEEEAFVVANSGLRALGLISAPHLVITAEGAIFSSDPFIISSPKIGIAAPPEDTAQLKALTLYLNSSIGRYLQFFSNAPWGIYINTSQLGDIKTLPYADLSNEQVQTLATAYDNLVQKEQSHFTRHILLQNPEQNYQGEIDAAVETTFNIPTNLGVIARDFMQVRYQLLEGKTGDTASKPPSNADLQYYAEQFREIVDSFARRHHRIVIAAGAEAILATMEVTNASEPLPVEITREWNAAASRILKAANEQHSQWAYIQRSVRIFDGPRAHIVKAARLLDWTRTQAVQDAADLVAEVLDKTASYHERITA